MLISKGKTFYWRGLGKIYSEKRVFQLLSLLPSKHTSHRINLVEKYLMLILNLLERGSIL